MLEWQTHKNGFNFPCSINTQKVQNYVIHSLSLIENKNSIDIHCVKGQHAENFKVKVGQAKKLGDYHHCVVQHNSCLTSQSLLEETFLFRLEILLTDFSVKKQ